jgi:acetyl-CoA carboxylase carboxyltransferase component
VSWESAIEELRRREGLAHRMGEQVKVDRHHNAGKLTVRERIDALLDKGSFHEIGAISGKADYDEDGNLVDLRASNFIMGRGKINDRVVVVAGDDFTVRGGAADASIREKPIFAEQMANEYRLPIVRLIDGTGGGGSVKSLEMDGRTYIPANPGWEWVVRNLSTVPVVGLALGSVAGLGAARAVTSHYSLMVKGLSQMFVAGPVVVARVSGPITKEELGGSEIHTRNGAIDDEVESEAEAFERTARFLSYLPSSIHTLPPRGPVTDDINRREESLISAVPVNKRKVYKMRKIINSVVDEGSFFEIGRQHGKSAITGFARLDGWPVAILANDPYIYGGSWTADASHKVTRFIDLANTFHLPVVHLVDNPGFLIGLESEKAGTIRHGAHALAALYQADVPWCTIIVRKAFGVAGAGNSNHSKLFFRYAWPSADTGSLPIAGGLEAAYKADLEGSDDPDALLADIEERLIRVCSPFRTAEAFRIEEIIDPRDTRPLLCEFANLAAPLRKPGPATAPYRP